ncbi:MAG: zinc-dependent metalloprotease [Candidatus Kapaibacterium sp.]
MRSLSCLVIVMSLFVPRPLHAQDSKPAASLPASPKPSIKPWSEVFPADVKADSGVFNVYRVDDKVFYEIPVREYRREFLLVSRISKTPQIGYGGEQVGSAVVAWERKYDKVLLRTKSYVNTAADSLPIAKAVRSSNFEEIVAALPIQCYNKDSSAVVIDVTTLFTTDIGLLTPPKSQRDQYKISALSTDRSFVEYARSYPLNVEVENVLTFSADAAPQNAGSRTVSISMHHSMVALPEKPMKPRIQDWRVGFFTVSTTDYGLDNQRAEARSFITRWRLEPRDPAAYFRGETVEPVKPITYYIDPATPMKWRPWLKKGIETWNSAFEKAGFRNAVRVLPPPDSSEDPEFCPEDVRYSVIRYFPSPIENAYGPHVSDPRTGEILESDIGWYHNVMNLQTGWYFTQAVADPRSHKIPFPDSLMGELIATVAAHEFGHTIGFPHNMKASSSYPVDSLRSPSFTSAYGTAPTIMDYARYNYVAQPGDGAALMPKVGPYDDFAVNWGYRVLPGDLTPEQEQDSLQAWIRVQDANPMLRFGRQQWMTVDPSAQMEDLGDDAVKASTLGIANLKRIMGYLVEATTTSGKDYDLLREMYEEVFQQWRREVGHVAENVAGMVGTYKNAGQAGVVYQPVAREKQIRCLEFLHEYVFTTPQFLLDPEVLRRIEASGSIERLQRGQERILSTVMANDKLLRLIESAAINGENGQDLGVAELLDNLRNGLFADLLGTGTPDVFRRNLQRTYVANLVAKLSAPAPSLTPISTMAAMFAPPNVYKTDVRALVRAQLETLAAKLKKSGGSDIAKAHKKDLLVIIDDALRPSKDR